MLWIFLALMVVFAGFALYRVRRRRIVLTRQTDEPKLEEAVAEPVAPEEEKVHSFPKALHTPTDVSVMLFECIDTDVPMPVNSPIQPERLTSESIYLELFMVDFATYMNVKDDYARTLVLEMYWDYVSGARLNMPTVEMRVDLYSAAVQDPSIATEVDTWVSLGKAFAQACLVPGDAVLMQHGADTARIVMNRVSELFSRIAVET